MTAYPPLPGLGKAPAEHWGTWAIAYTHFVLVRCIAAGRSSYVHAPELTTGHPYVSPVDYPPPPFDVDDVESDELYPVWLTVMDHLAWMGAWLTDGMFLGTRSPFPGELTTGHDVLCTARYDAEADCYELDGCALLYDDEIPPPRCTCRYWQGYVARWFQHGENLMVWHFLINPNCWHHGDGFRW